MHLWDRHSKRLMSWDDYRIRYTESFQWYLAPFSGDIICTHLTLRSKSLRPCGPGKGKVWKTQKSSCEVPRSDAHLWTGSVRQSCTFLLWRSSVMVVSTLTAFLTTSWPVWAYSKGSEVVSEFLKVSWWHSLKSRMECFKSTLQRLASVFGF